MTEEEIKLKLNVKEVLDIYGSQGFASFYIKQGWKRGRKDLLEIIINDLEKEEDIDSYIENLKKELNKYIN